MGIRYHEDVICYSAESLVAHLWSVSLNTPESVFEFFDSMNESRFVKSRYPWVYNNPPTIVVVGNHAYSKTFKEGNRIEMSRLGLSTWDCIHEYAHICDKRSWKQHHTGFFEKQVDLVGRFIDPDAGRALRHAYMAVELL